MRFLPEKIIFTLIGLVLLGWVGYHVVSSYYRPLDTETVFEYSVSDTFVASGIAVREERVIEETVSGIENYLYADAERVTIGAPIAEFYSSRGSDRNIKRMREIRDEIDMLRLTQDKNANNFANADSLNRDIREQLGRLTSMAGADSYGQSGEIRIHLRELLNRRQIATGKAENYAERIAALEQEYQALEQATSGADVITVRTPVSGYFVKSVDGYERTLSPRLVQDYKQEDYLELLAAPRNNYPVGFVGKMVTSHNWLFILSVPKENIENFKQGQKVELEFPEIGAKTPATIDEILRENSSDETVMVFRCSFFSEQLAGIRYEEVRVLSTPRTGLRINTAAIRYIGDVMGVYVVEDNVLRFKEVNSFYDGVGFVLADMNIKDVAKYQDMEDQVRLYHQIVTKGTDLYDGKVVG